MKRLWMQLWELRDFWPLPLLWTTIPAVAGVVFGHLSAAGAAIPAQNVLGEIVTAYAIGGQGMPSHSWMGIGLALVTAALLFFSGKTAAGLLLIPTIVLLHSFLLSFMVSVLLYVAGGGLPLWESLWKMGAVLLPVCLLEWPAMLLLAAQSTAGAGARLLHGFAPRMRWEAYTRAALCFVFLCMAAAVRAWPVPWLMSTLLL
jgi:hypothetical protein